LPHDVHEVDTRTMMPPALSQEGIRELGRAFAEAAELAYRL
jgi:2,4-dienoyl-CoA reductase-like NADH-dependent reductase (Old Yellow Enzyme family)